MKRGFAVAAVVAALGFAVAGCTGDSPGNTGNGTNTGTPGKGFPKAGDWGPEFRPYDYTPDDATLDIYLGSARKAQVIDNGLQHLLVKTYMHNNWNAVEGKPDIRKLMVEMYFYKSGAGAAKTFQEWHTGVSFNDVGEKGFLADDAVVFLRGSVCVRIAPRDKWAPKEAREPAIQLAKAIDNWLCGK